MYIHLHSTDSTNSHLRRIIAEGQHLPDMTIVSAYEQTAGRGQKGNSWETEPGMNVIFSLLCHPATIPPTHQFILSQCIAIAISQTLSVRTDGITIKWPNDIYWNDSKISGILIECDLKGKTISNCIIGCGININQTLFRSDAPNPVSLKNITGQDYDTETILHEVAERYATLYNEATKGNDTYITALYMQNLYRKDGLHPYEDCNGTFFARISSIEPTGHLILETEQGEKRRYEFKEVKFVLPQHSF